MQDYFFISPITHTASHGPFKGRCLHHTAWPNAKIDKYVARGRVTQWSACERCVIWYYWYRLSPVHSAKLWKTKPQTDTWIPKPVDMVLHSSEHNSDFFLNLSFIISVISAAQRAFFCCASTSLSSCTLFLHISPCWELETQDSVQRPAPINAWNCVSGARPTLVGQMPNKNTYCDKKKKSTRCYTNTRSCATACRYS